MKLALIDNSSRFWSFWTTWWNATWCFVSATVAAYWVAADEATRAYTLSLIGLDPATAVGVIAALVPAITAGSLALRVLKQAPKPDPSPETQPDWKAIDSTESPTVPMTDAQTRQVNPGVGANRR
jgi:hypothetical protein